MLIGRGVNKMKKTAVFSLVTTIVFWLVVSFVDFLYEKTTTGISDIEMVIYIIFTYFLWIPAIVMYIRFMKKSGQRDKRMKEKLIDKLIWIGINIALYIPIFNMVNYNNWIVKQVSGALDGVEYMVTGVMFGVCSLIGFVIYDIVVYLKNK